MAHAERLRELEQGHHGRVAPTAFQAGKVLLIVTGALFDLLLSQTLGAPDTGERPTSLRISMRQWMPAYTRSRYTL